MADTKWSQFPSATPDSADEVVGLHAGGNARFSLANLVYAVRNGLGNIFQSKITASGILKGDGAGGVSAAVAGTDYATPSQIPTVPSAYTSNPEMDGTASPGSSNDYARGDHVHPENPANAKTAQLAYVETGTTASQAYAVGKYFIWNGLLYRVTSTISSGQPFNPGSNCEQVSVGGLNDVVAPKAITNYTLSNSSTLASIQTVYTICYQMGKILFFFISFKAGTSAIAAGSTFADLTVDSNVMAMVTGVTGSANLVGARLGLTRIVLKNLGASIPANDTFSVNMMLILS